MFDWELKETVYSLERWDEPRGGWLTILAVDGTEHTVLAEYDRLKYRYPDGALRVCKREKRVLATPPADDGREESE